LSGSRLRNRGCVRPVILALLTLSAVPASGGERVALPIKLQAELLAKVSPYDRRFDARVQGHVNVLILVKPNSPESRRAALQMQDMLSAQSLIGGYPHTEYLENYTTAPALATVCQAKKIAILYVTPAFDRELETMRKELSRLDLLSVGAVDTYVEHGIVLGFDLVAGKPQMLVNLTQAKKQNVQFRAALLRLMRVYE
jgi:hypothetical protein